MPSRIGKDLGSFGAGIRRGFNQGAKQEDTPENTIFSLLLLLPAVAHVTIQIQREQDGFGLASSICLSCLPPCTNIQIGGGAKWRESTDLKRYRNLFFTKCFDWDGKAEADLGIGAVLKFLVGERSAYISTLFLFKLVSFTLEVNSEVHTFSLPQAFPKWAATARPPSFFAFFSLHFFLNGLHSRSLRTHPYTQPSPQSFFQGFTDHFVSCCSFA